MSDAPVPAIDRKADAARSNALHRKLIKFVTAFGPEFEAWLSTGPSEEAFTQIYTALRIAGDEFYSLSDKIPAPGEAGAHGSAARKAASS